MPASPDGFHLVAPTPPVGVICGPWPAHPDRRADTRDISHVNAHATSTPIGDTAEAVGILSAVGNHAAIYAPKSALGH